MKIFPSNTIKKLDAYTIEHEPIQSIQLMERAANALTEAITNRWVAKPRLLYLPDLVTMEETLLP